MLETYKILRNVVSFFSWIKAGNNRGLFNPFFLLFCERNKIKILLRSSLLFSGKRATIPSEREITKQRFSEALWNATMTVR